MEFFDQLRPDKSKRKKAILSQNPSAQLACRVAEEIYSLLMEWMWWLLQTAVMLYQEYNSLKNFKCKLSKFNDKKKQKNMINQIKAVMFVQDAERKAWLGILQKQRCPVFPVTTRNRAEQAQHGRWLFKITRVGGSCAGCPRLRLSPHAVLCWERRGRQNFPNFPGRNRRAGEDFLLQLTLRGEGSREQLFTCCQDFLLWSCLESDNLDRELKN